MPLHSISEDGMITWGCHHKDCVHHKDHPEHVPNRAHISHEEVVYHDHNLVALPYCDCEKGSRTLIRVSWPEEELQPAVVHHDSLGRIVQVDIPGAPNLTKITEHVEHDARGNAIRVIDKVEPHPAIALHQEFKRQLDALGKVYVPPKVAQPAFPMQGWDVVLDMGIPLQERLAVLMKIFEAWGIPVPDRPLSNDD